MEFVIAFASVALFVLGVILVLKGIWLFFCGDPFWKVRFKRGWWLILIGFIVYIVGGVWLASTVSSSATNYYSTEI